MHLGAKEFCFDQAIKIPLDQLNNSYLISIRPSLHISPPHTIETPSPSPSPSPSSSPPPSSPSSSLSERRDNNLEASLNRSESTKVKLKKKKKATKGRDSDYDYEDPFIDDSEMADVYHSVLDLLHYHDDSDEEDSHDSFNEDQLEDNLHLNEPEPENYDKLNRNQIEFYVYRGPLPDQIYTKEFEGEITAAGAEEKGRGGGGESLKRKKPRQTSLASTSKTKKSKLSFIPSVPSPEKKIKDSLSKKKKPRKVTIIEDEDPAQSTFSKSLSRLSELFNDESQVATDQVIETVEVKLDDVVAENKDKKIQPAIAYDYNLLELKEIINRFSIEARKTPFSPGKFPSVLRSLLNESTYSALRTFKPNIDSIFPLIFLSSLASFLPFSESALYKLLTRKILPTIQSDHLTLLPNLYQKWQEMVKERIESNAFITYKDKSAPVTVNDPASSDKVEDPSSQNKAQSKKRIKFHEEMRQVIFDIVRNETDASLIKYCIDLLEYSQVQHMGAKDNNIEQSQEDQTKPCPPKLVHELFLRKQVYQKILQYAELVYPKTTPPETYLSTTEISKEMSAHKRKFEKNLVKIASEITFDQEPLNRLFKSLNQMPPAQSFVPPPQSSDTPVINNLESASSVKATSNCNQE